MKTKLTLLLAAFSVSVAAYAGPGGSTASFATQHALDMAKGQTTTSAAPATVSGPVTYIPSSTGRGGSVVAVHRDGTTNIALFKSKKAKSECSSCKADAKKQ